MTATPSELKVLTKILTEDMEFVELTLYMMRDVVHCGEPTEDELNHENKSIADYAGLVKAVCSVGDKINDFKEYLDNLGPLSEEERDAARALFTRKLPALKQMVQDVCPTFAESPLEAQVAAIEKASKKKTPRKKTPKKTSKKKTPKKSKKRSPKV